MSLVERVSKGVGIEVTRVATTQVRHNTARLARGSESTKANTAQADEALHHVARQVSMALRFNADHRKTSDNGINKVNARRWGERVGSLFRSNRGENQESFWSKLGSSLIFNAAKGGLEGTFKVAQKALENGRDVHRQKVNDPDTSNESRQKAIKNARREQNNAWTFKRIGNALGRLTNVLDGYDIINDLVHGKTEDAISKTIGTAAESALTSAPCGAAVEAEAAGTFTIPLIPPTVAACGALGAGVNNFVTEHAKPVVHWTGNKIGDAAEWTGNAADNTIDFIGDIL